MLTKITLPDFEVRCPFCGKHLFNQNDPDRLADSTVWSGQGFEEEERCPHCGNTIYLRESVVRYWEVKKTKEELEETEW